MLDDFFYRAIIAGIGVALVTGPLGCFVIWRRLSYFGDSMSHTALLGVALGLLAEISIPLAVLAVCVVASAILLLLEAHSNIASDALLGIFSHGALALGIVALSLMTWVRFDLTGLLFGDILAVSKPDIALTYAGAGIILATLIYNWRPLFAATVSHDIAEAEGLRPARAKLIFTLLTACTIALSIKIVGALLITAMLIIPAATARRFAVSPESMAVGAVLIGVTSVVAGLFGSLTWDTPSGPSIVVAATLFFALSQLPIFNLLTQSHRNAGGQSK